MCSHLTSFSRRKVCVPGTVPSRLTCRNSAPKSYHAVLIRFNSRCFFCASAACEETQLTIEHRGTGMSLLAGAQTRHPSCMTHEKLVSLAVAWLRRYGCGVVLSEQSCASGETPDAIGWKRACHSVVVECKISRADFLADREKPFRCKQEIGMGCERFYLAPAGLIRSSELPAGWGLLEIRGRAIEVMNSSSKNLRSARGFRREMNLLLASLRRVEVRIEPQSITDFLKWKNRMAEYNRGSLPEGIVPAQEEGNCFLEAVDGD